MEKYTSYVLSACLIIVFTFLVSENAFSQANPKESNIEAADSVTTISDGTSPYVSGITTGRSKALVGGVLGLISLIIGWRAKVRSAKGTNSRTGAIAALVVGLTGIVLSVVHLSTSAGAVFGSGSGKAGAIVGLALSLIGTTLGGLTLRKRHI